MAKLFSRVFAVNIYIEILLGRIVNGRMSFFAQLACDPDDAADHHA